VTDGMIVPGQAPATWGFTLDRFEALSYLWRSGDEVVWSFVATTMHGKGYLSALRKGIEADGLRVAVPTPFPRMVEILERWGFEPSLERDEQMQCDVVIWRKPAAAILSALSAAKAKETGR